MNLYRVAEAGPMPRRVAMLSVHTSPLAQPGTGDAGGMNVYVLEVSRRLAAAGVEVEVFTRATSSEQPATEHVADRLTVHNVMATVPDPGEGRPTRPVVRGDHRSAADRSCSR